jgi:hypothetical protein
MKVTFLILRILVLVSLGLSCIPEATLKVSTTDDDISISATLVEDGVRIENLGGINCLIFVTSAEGEQQFELAAGQNVAVSGVSQPFEVSAVTL